MRNDERIDMQKYLHVYDTLEVGETVRIDHQECGDTRGRLYFTRTVADPDTVLGFCHNCQAAGVDGTFDGYRSSPPQPSGVRMLDNHAGQGNYVSDVLPQESLSKQPPEVVAFCLTKGITGDLWEGLRLKYNPSTDKIVFPMRDSLYFKDGESVPYDGSELRGEQERRIRGTGQKWITSKDKDWQPGCLLWSGGTPRHKHLVIVEDILSACRVKQAVPETEVLCNYGVQVKPEALHEVLTVYKYDNISVWLDNDNDIVKEQARKMSRTLLMLASSDVAVHTIHMEEDPKNIDFHTIHTMLDVDDG